MSDDPNDQGLSRKHLLSTVDASLRRMGTDYIDIFMVHAFDPDTPIEETMEALHDIVKSGKVLYLGASARHVCFTAARERVASAWPPFPGSRRRPFETYSLQLGLTGSYGSV